MNKIQDNAYKAQESVSQQIESGFGVINDASDPCSKGKIQINNNISSIKVQQTGDNDSLYDPGF